MRTFKRNITITFTINFIAIILFMIPSFFIFFLYDESPDFKIVFHIITGLIVIILVVIIFMFPITLIGYLFIKKKTILYDTHFTHDDESMNYEDINVINYDMGTIGKTGSTPSKISFFKNDYKGYMYIEDPSLIMCIILRNRCKNAKLTITGFKTFLWVGIIFFVFAIVGLIYFKIK